MKDSHRKRSLLVILILYPFLLAANIKMELAAKIKATTDKTQGIFTMVDTILMKGWKAAGMKFRFHRSITGANDFKQLHENWGPYQLFDVEATPGIWYEYKVEVLEKGAKKSYFLTPLEPVKGFRPPSKSIAAQFHWDKLHKYKGHIYLDWDFLDGNGNLILPDSATYHVKYDTEQEMNWILSLDTPVLEKVHHETETTQSRLVIKQVEGMKKINICIRVIQNGGVSRFFCNEVDLEKLPTRKPNFSPPSRIESMLKYLYPKRKNSIVQSFDVANSSRCMAYQAKTWNQVLNRKLGQAQIPRKHRLIRHVG